MGCNNGKVSAPKSAGAPDSAERTLLAPGPHGVEAEKSPKSPDSGAQDVDAQKSSGPEAGQQALGFEGAWSHGVISGALLTWADGRVSDIRIDEAGKVVEVTLEGEPYSGELRDDDKIYWNDGDVWSRRHVCATFLEFDGFTANGSNLLVETMTVEEAKCKAATLPHCVGFAVENNRPDSSVQVSFKSDWWNVVAVKGAACFKKEETSCAVGDAVMATFPLNGKRYPAEIASLGANDNITVNWRDGCLTHRTLTAMSVFKDRTADAPELVTADAGAVAAETPAPPPAESAKVADVAGQDLATAVLDAMTPQGGRPASRDGKATSPRRQEQEQEALKAAAATKADKDAHRGEDGRIARPIGLNKRKEKEGLCCC